MMRPTFPTSLACLLLTASLRQASAASPSELTDLPGIVVNANSYAPGGGEPELTIDNRDWEDGHPYLWSAGDHGTPEDPNWVQLDFGSDYYLARVELWGVFNPDLPIFWGYDNIFNLWAQPDGGDWVAIGSGRLVDSADAAERDATFNYLLGAQPQARYLRYEVVGGSHWSFLGEFNVLGTPVPEPSTFIFAAAGLLSVLLYDRTREI